MSMIAWIVLGLIAGFIASKLVNKTGEGIIVLDIMLGIVGAVVGGFVFNQLGAAGVTGFNLYSMLVAVDRRRAGARDLPLRDRATRGRLNLRSPNRKLRAGFAAGSFFSGRGCFPRQALRRRTQPSTMSTSLEEATMSNTNNQPIAVLNGLIETTLDSAYGYREAAGDARSPASRMITND